MNNKQLVLQAIGNLPEDVTFQQISKTVEFLGAIQKGIDQIERGETVPHAEVKRELARWLSE